MSIYTNFKPTYLYIKTHNITGLKYFGKTINDPYKYCGSGKRWLNHIRKHGYHITTEILGYYTNKEECISAALHFSVINNISSSDEWANIIPENGINGGGDCSQMHTSLVRKKVKNTVINKYGVDHVFKNQQIKLKSKTSYIEKYGSAGVKMSSQESIEKRNFTNLQKYGSKCAANQSGNILSIQSQKILRDRELVQCLRQLSKDKKKSLPRNWMYKDDHWMAQRIDEYLRIPDFIVDTSKYNSSQLKRHQLLNRKNVKELHILKEKYKLHLGRNWFQKSDEWVNGQIQDILRKINSQSSSDIVSI